MKLVACQPDNVFSKMKRKKQRKEKTKNKEKADGRWQMAETD